MSSAYPISSPVEFTNTSAGDTLIFNALGFSTPTKNLISDFVVTNPGDLLFREGTGTSNTLERLGIGSTGEVLTVTGTAVAQIQDVTTVADIADSLDGTYFLLNSPTEAHYFWISTSGGSATDPGLGVPVPADLLLNDQLKTSHIVSITTGDTAVAVAGVLDGVISGLSDFNTLLAAPLITVTNTINGACDTAVDGTTATGFVIPAATTAGVSALPAWAPPTPGSALDTFLAEATVAVATSIAAGSTWVTVDSSIVTWDDSTLPNHDAGGNFTPGTGVFSVPSTGIYALSCNIAFEGNNSGNGGGGITGRRAVRQARIRNTTTGATMAFGEQQARPVNLDPTQINMVVAAISVTAGDVLVVQVRHDARVNLALSVNEDGTPTQGPATYFSATRIA